VAESAAADISAHTPATNRANFSVRGGVFQFMNSFQTHTTVENAGQLVLRGLPFKPGEKVRVVVESERSIEERRLQEKERAAELFQSIAARSDKDEHFQSLTEAEIAEEIAAYRRGE
jgi:hypothetical protein